MSEELLKPCSVCGGKDIRICETEVYCGVCGHGFIFKNYDTRGKALDWWNRRAIEDALRAEIAELKAALDALYIKLFLASDVSQISPKYAEELMSYIEEVIKDEPATSDQAQSIAGTS